MGGAVSIEAERAIQLASSELDAKLPVVNKMSEDTLRVIISAS